MFVTMINYSISVVFHTTSFTDLTTHMQTAKLQGTSYQLSSSLSSSKNKSSSELLPGEFRRVIRKRGNKKQPLSPTREKTQEKIDQLSAVLPFFCEPQHSSDSLKKTSRTAAGVDGIESYFKKWKLI